MWQAFLRGKSDFKLLLPVVLAAGVFPGAQAQLGLPYDVGRVNSARTRPIWFSDLAGYHGLG